MLDDVLDGLSTGRDWSDQLPQHGLVVRMVRVLLQAIFVDEIGDQPKIGIPVLHPEIAAESVRLDARNLVRELVEGSLDLGDVLSRRLGLPAKEGDVA